MIVPMKKISVLVQSKDSAATIEMLRSLGVLHVEHQRLEKGKDISNREADISLVKKAIRVLEQQEIAQEYPAPEKNDMADWKFTAMHIVDLGGRLQQLEHYAFALKKEIGQWEAWGDFSPDAVLGLKEQGIQIKLYQVPLKQAGDFPSNVIVKTISQVKGTANCAVIFRGQEHAVSELEKGIPFKEIALPKMGLNDMKARISEDRELTRHIKEYIGKYVCYHGAFLRILRMLQEELEFYQVLGGMGQSGNLGFLTGYVPFDAVKLLQQTARIEKWGLLVKDPSAEDKVPTLIRNPRWVSIINPVFKLIDVIPGYKELDISLWFLIFFSIFFGMLIGDAGLGLSFFLLAFFARQKWGKKVKDQSIFILLYISSLCAIIWGALTGTFFGQAWLAPSVKPLLPALRDDKNIQALCFFIGAVHLSIAHAWRGIAKMPSLSALADAGWILILWGAFFLARFLILEETLPVYALWLLIAGAGLVVFFAKPNRNFVKGIGAGIGSLLLNIMNSFTDIVSYIRLFAVGLATVAVADAFNAMAMDVGYGSIASGLVTCLILLLGHTLNVLLGPMSILVHGVRLNVLEFSSHLDVQWKGFAYRPLKKMT